VLYGDNKVHKWRKEEERGINEEERNQVGSIDLKNTIAKMSCF
jgi:hypothetical protein